MPSTIPIKAEFEKWWAAEVDDIDFPDRTWRDSIEAAFYAGANLNCSDKGGCRCSQKQIG